MPNPQSDSQVRTALGEGRLVIFVSGYGWRTDLILEHARPFFQGRFSRVIFVTSDDNEWHVHDILPTLGEVVSISSFQCMSEGYYILIENCSYSSQLLGLIKRLVQAEARFEVWTRSNDKVIQLW